MSERKLYIVKPELAFRDIRHKRVYISSTIPNTEDGVIVKIIGEGINGYKYRLRDLMEYAA